MSAIKTLPGGRLTPSDAAEYLGTAPGTLAKHRSMGRGPRYLRVGGRIFYRVADLDAYLSSCAVETEDSRGKCA